MTARGERGSVLVLGALLGALLLTFFAVAYEATMAALRADGFFVKRDLRAASVTRGLARGLRALETGLPPGNPYSALVVLDDEGVVWRCAVTFDGHPEQDHWVVSARLATDRETDLLPPLPPSF